MFELCFWSFFGSRAASHGRGQEWRRNKHNTTCIGIGIEYGYSSFGVRPLDGEVLLVALRWEIWNGNTGKGMISNWVLVCLFGRFL